MSSTTAGLVTFTATATAGTAFETQLPLEASHASVPMSILGGGVNPIEFHSSHAIQLLVVQLVIIICLSRFLHWGFSKICPWTSQPRVVFEILAGILLGPTAFGQIPHFSEHIFPSESLPFMNLLATIGLVLFLLCVGLEVDWTLFRRNLKPSMSVSLAGLVIPFSLGWAVSVGLYHQFVDKSVTMTTFSCFIATSSSITAFPVLGRILVDLKLMSDPVGVVVLASGVANDVIGWMLLALSVALATSGSGGSSGIVVLYILLTTAAWMLFLFYAVRPLLNYVARKTGSFSNPDGPTQTYILAVLMATFISGWFMAAIGISEIFGGFLVGLIIPTSLGHHIAAKIEDLCICIFIPLYFAYSGLRTNLTLLNTGVIWGWTVCVIVCAFCGKFFGCFFAARFTGFTSRESAGVGFLMSSKGLIELIILNQGLSVGIINETVFSIFVLEALLLTFAATPGTLIAYPAHVRRPAVAAKASAAGLEETDPSVESKKHRPDASGSVKRITVVLDKLESLGALFVFTNLLSSSSSSKTKSGTNESSATTASTLPPAPPISINPLRLIELTERLSGVLLASDAAAEPLRSDPLTLLYRTFANLVGGGGSAIAVRDGEFAVTQSDNFADTVQERSARDDSDLIVVPWTLSQDNQEQESVVASYLPNPFEHLFGNNSSSNPSSSTQPDSSRYASFLRDLFASATCDVGLFFDRGLVESSRRNSSSPGGGGGGGAFFESGSTRIFLPFFGGSDDRACLALAVQLAQRSPLIHVTVVVIQRAPEETEEDRLSLNDSSSSSMRKGDSDDTNASTLKGPALQLTVAGGGGGGGGTHHSTPGGGGGELGGSARPGETLYPTQHALASETEDDLVLEQTRAAIALGAYRGTVEIVSTETAFPLKTMTRRAAHIASECHSTTTSGARFVFLLGRSRRDASSHRVESLSLLKLAEKEGTLGIAASQEVRKCIGEAASAAVISGVGENIWVVQSGKTGGKRITKAFKAGEA